MASPQNPSPENSDLDFETAISEVEQQLAALKTRYLQVETDTNQKQQLEKRLQEIKQNLSQRKSSALKAELKQIKDQLEAIELNLESQLFSWSGIKQPFWQAVRFLGLGIVVGWFLKSCSG
jgi:predicted  nucleic acid-binding Zn-ribbon protein